MLRVIVLTTLSALLALATGRAGEGAMAQQDCVELPPDPRPRCIDAVVRARIVRYDPGPMDFGSDVIVMRWPWTMDIEVRDVFLGDVPGGRLTIGATLHTEFDPALRQPILFLTRTPEGGWYLEYIEFAARESGGGFAIPIYEPDNVGSLSPEGWLPVDYHLWLKPIRYRARDVAAFGNNWDQTPDGEDVWRRVHGKRITAKRGFRVTDLPQMLTERRALDCRRL